MRTSGRTKLEGPGAQLRPFQGTGSLREYRSEADWVPIEFLIYYDAKNKMRAVAYIRRQDGAEISDGQYEIVDELGEHRRRWTKWNGQWQVKWRHRWNRNQ